MQPVVDGLGEQYGEQVDFISLNALDGGQGQAALAAYGLRGHPSLVLVEPDGDVSSVRLGVIPRDDLEQAILAMLAP